MKNDKKKDFSCVEKSACHLSKKKKNLKKKKKKI